MKNRRIYITGVSGTGKTTLGQELQKMNISTLSIDEVEGLCFWVNKKTGKKVDYEAKLDQKFINAHDWICDVDQLKSLLNTDGLAVVLGMVENQMQLLHLFDKVLLLQCSPEIFINRIEYRKDNDFGKDKTVQDFILSMYKGFESTMLQNGAISIDAEEPIQGVLDQVIKQIKS